MESVFFGDSSSLSANAIAVDASGDVLLTGALSGTVNFGGAFLVNSGSEDMFVAKFAADGTHQWSRSFGDSAVMGGGVYGNSVAVDASGNVLVTGSNGCPVDFGGGPLPGNDYSWYGSMFLVQFDLNGNYVWSRGGLGPGQGSEGTGIAVDASGNVVATGSIYSGAFGTEHLVKKFDPSGIELWSKDLLNFWGESKGTGITLDASGNVVVIGDFSETVDFGGGPIVSVGASNIFLAKYDPSGTHLWSQRFGDANSQGATSVAVNASGNVLMTGYFKGTVDFGGGGLTSAGNYDVFVAEFNPNGSHLWSRSFGDVNSQQASAVAVDALDNVLVTGTFTGTVDLGGGGLTSAGSSDVFLAKFGTLSPPPEPLGIYADEASTNRVLCAEPYVPTTFYLIGTVPSFNPPGVTGAEFRIEVSNPTGYLFTYTPPNGAVVNGSPLTLRHPTQTTPPG